MLAGKSNDLPGLYKRERRGDNPHCAEDQAPVARRASCIRNGCACLEPLASAPLEPAPPAAHPRAQARSAHGAAGLQGSAQGTPDFPLVAIALDFRTFGARVTVGASRWGWSSGLGLLSVVLRAGGVVV